MEWILALLFVFGALAYSRWRRVSGGAQLPHGGFTPSGKGAPPQPKWTLGPRATFPRVDGHHSFLIGNDVYYRPGRSPNGRYLAGAFDAGAFIDKMDSRGSVVLVERASGAVLFRQPVQRPNNPHVSDAGIVVVEDWKDSRLSGALLAFNATDALLWQQQFAANILTSGMSADGSLAFVSTANCPTPHDAWATLLIRVHTGEVLWRRHGLSDIRFAGNSLVCDVKTPAGRTRSFPLDEAGRPPEAYARAVQQLRDHQYRDDPAYLLRKARAAFEGGDLSEAAKLLEAAPLLAASDPKSKLRAKTLRLKGEIAAAEGRSNEALALWAEALALDPRVGIKKQYDAMVARTEA